MVLTSSVKSFNSLTSGKTSPELDPEISDPHSRHNKQTAQARRVQIEIKWNVVHA